MVKSPFPTFPALGGKPASLRKASSVYKRTLRLVSDCSVYFWGSIDLVVIVRLEKSSTHNGWGVYRWHDHQLGEVNAVVKVEMVGQGFQASVRLSRTGNLIGLIAFRSSASSLLRLHPFINLDNPKLPYFRYRFLS